MKAVVALAAAFLAIECSTAADSNVEWSVDRPIGNWIAVRGHDRFTQEHLFSALGVNIAETRSTLTIFCRGRFDPEALVPEEATKEDRLRWARLIPRDETGSGLWLQMRLYTPESQLNGNAEVSTKVDDDLLYDGMESEVDEGEVEWPLTVRDVDALREGTTFRVQLVTEDGERYTYVFPLAGFTRAYRWLAAACPIRRNGRRGDLLEG